MESRMDEFRDFVGRYPKIRDDVRSGKRTWQNIYEEWVIYGENDQQWLKYTENDTASGQTTNMGQGKNPTTQPSLNDSIKNIVSYVQKINPNSLNRTLNTVQKIVQIAQSFGGKSNVQTNYMNSAYNDWWD